MVLKRVGPLSSAKISATVYALIGLLFGALLTLGAITGMGAGGEGAGMMGMMMGIGAIIVLPILYGVIGFIAGALGAVIYNLAAGMVGGVEMDLQ